MELTSQDKVFLALLLTLALAVIVIEGKRPKHADTTINKAPPSLKVAPEPWWTGNLPTKRHDDSTLHNTAVME